MRRQLMLSPNSALGRFCTHYFLTLGTMPNFTKGQTRLEFFQWLRLDNVSAN